MSELNVRIVKLEPMRVASAYGFGKEPEGQAGDKMTAFLKGKGLYEDYSTKYQHFGFNNPDPSPGSPNYGYEIWVTIPEEVQPEGDIRIVGFCGGLYAVTRFEDLDKIGSTWKALVRWRENSKYRMGGHQWLEHLLTPKERDFHKFVFDLYMPISE
jgi:DNA gyrase inhibitor GyrI